MELFLRLAFVAAVAAAAWYALRPRPAFVVTVADGVARLTRGKVTAPFLRDVQEVCNQNDLRRGTLKGFVRGRRVVLSFSRHVPADCRQQLRNRWALHG